MARLLLLIFLLSVAVAAVAGNTFDDANPIRLASDLESQVLDVIGQSRHALSFARFARRYGKRYNSVDEIQHRFRIFSDNLRLIRSTNKRTLTYTLGVNRMCSLSHSLLLLASILIRFYLKLWIVNPADFADWTWEEFRRHRLGAAQNCSATLKGSHRLTDAALPDEVASSTVTVTALLQMSESINYWNFNINSWTVSIEGEYRVVVVVVTVSIEGECRIVVVFVTSIVWNVRVLCV